MTPEYTREELAQKSQNNSIWDFPKKKLIRHYWLLPLEEQNKIKENYVMIEFHPDYGKPSY